MSKYIMVIFLILCLTGCTDEVEPHEYPDSMVKAEIDFKIWEATFAAIVINDYGISFRAYDSPTLEKNFGLLTVISEKAEGGILPLRPMEFHDKNGNVTYSNFKIPNEEKVWYGEYPSIIKFYIDSISSFNEYTLAHGRFNAYACNGDNIPYCVSPDGTYTNVPVFFHGEERSTYFLSINANYYNQYKRN